MSTEAGQMDCQYPSKQVFPPPNQDPSAVQWQPRQNPILPKAASRDIENQENSTSKNHYLPLSVFTVIFCCFPLSVFALISSVKAKSKFEAGEFSSGRKHAQRALLFSLASIVTGILVNIIVISVIAYRFSLVTQRFRG